LCGDLDITLWLEWFLGCLENAIEQAKSKVLKVLEKTHFWDALGEISLNARQRKMIELLLEGFEGKLTSTKWAKITKCSQDTSSRDIIDLIEKGVLSRCSEGGRSTHYLLQEKR